MLIIQILLIAAVLLMLAYYVRSRGSARSSAVFKLCFLAFCIFGVYTVLRPGDLGTLAHWVGVGRGSDLLLYGLVVTFAFVTIGTYLRFRELELRYTRLARSIALRNAEWENAEAGAADE